MDDAIERDNGIDDVLEPAMCARGTLPEGFEEDAPAELAEPPSDAELDAWMEEVDSRPERAIEEDEDSIAWARRRQRLVLRWSLRKLGLPESAAELSPREVNAPVAEPSRMAQAAIERTRDMERRVRSQTAARLAFPWRFEEYPLADLADPRGEPELEQLMWELDWRHREGIARAEEL
jgi:hypothetical protein